MSAPIVIITAPSHPFLVETFIKNGFIVEDCPKISYDELAQRIPYATGLVVTTRLQIDQNLLDRAPLLKWIGRLGSGMELIDTAYAFSKGIECFSSPEGNRNAVAEHALGLLLNLTNHISRSFEEISKGLWQREENRGIELDGKTIGIIGFGNTGSAFAKILSGFDVNILAYDKYKNEWRHDNVISSTLENVLEKSDIISMHVPLTPETYHMANFSFFEKMNRKPIFISTCRGKVTHTEALINALATHTISAAGLDVMENEKLNTLNEVEKSNLYWLCDQKNVVLTPHIAGYSQEAFYKMSAVLLKKLGLLN